jgi:hypothetical protein
VTVVFRLSYLCSRADGSRVKQTAAMIEQRKERLIPVRRMMNGVT